MTDAPYDDAAPRLAPHPRIRQRRVEVKRDEGRRRLRIVVGLVAAAALSCLVFGLTRSPLLDVDRVHVRGATQTAPDDVIRAAGLDRHPPLIDLDAERLSATIERLPWVEHATVARRWPGTVEVTLLERSPLAAIPTGPETAAIVDVSGRVLAVGTATPGELVRVEAATTPGAPGTRVDAATRSALSLVAALPEVLVGRVPSVAVTESSSLELRLDEVSPPTPRTRQIPVAFGAPRQQRAKLVALTTIVQKADLRRVRSIDVRVPTAPVLTRG